MVFCLYVLSCILSGLQMVDKLLWCHQRESTSRQVTARQECLIFSCKSSEDLASNKGNLRYTNGLAAVHAIRHCSAITHRENWSMGEGHYCNWCISAEVSVKPPRTKEGRGLHSVPKVASANVIQCRKNIATKQAGGNGLNKYVAHTWKFSIINLVQNLKAIGGGGGGCTVCHQCFPPILF